ncbi:MAG: hypothetical protein K2K58_08325, partial [Muribaculaceae bacterium]|nr:hypothetical protein [Muribaculaceae bacterium]
KKTTIFFAVLSAALFGTSFEAAAQRDNRHDKGVVSVINNDTVDALKVEKHLKSNAPQSPNDNGLPRFAIVGKDHKYYIGVGAQFLGEAVYDFGDNMPSPILFTPSSITPRTPGNGSALRFGWQSSSVYLNAVALPGTKDQIGLFFKANFLGNDNAFNIFQFYAKYRGLTAGYTTSAFSDGAAEPMTIDFEGPNGYPYAFLFTAYWTQNFTKNFSGAIGIDAPTASLTTGSTTSTINQRIPAIPLYLQYAWDEGNSHIRLSGLVRPMQYRNLSANKNETLTGVGVQLSGMTKVVGPLSFSYNAAYGKGISNYLQDDNGLGLDAVATGKAGNMEMVKSLGVTAGLNCAITPKLSANLVYSHLSNWLPENAEVQDNQYRYGDYVAANLMYNINKFVSTGIEYDFGHRKSVTDASLHTNRLQIQLGVTF